MNSDYNCMDKTWNKAQRFGYEQCPEGHCV